MENELSTSQLHPRNTVPQYTLSMKPAGDDMEQFLYIPYYRLLASSHIQKTNDRSILLYIKYLLLFWTVI